MVTTYQHLPPTYWRDDIDIAWYLNDYGAMNWWVSTYWAHYSWWGEDLTVLAILLWWDIMSSPYTRCSLHRPPTSQYHRNVYNMIRLGIDIYMPLRWLRWIIRHTWAYVLYLIKSFLLLNTLGSKAHLQYLPLLDDLNTFNT